ncbi:unnamed protein product [Oncorhynchus mykiss]|uniref:Phosphoinositide phospholipase C n=1 Tax=Oncorhynchus mykiss TaxID=8022 RepID=A0A060YY12_ONCMY|nr:unnamed protein product [Oncorhynchus mykiss]
MSAENLLEFLIKEQREEATLADAHRLINKYELDDKAKEKQLMTQDGFLMYLHMPEGLVLNPTHKAVHQNMSQPLNHYFISSSHNTYLMEDQLKGPSSTEAYARALIKGCRCVELDCWDGSDGEPVIYHGYTLTSKILFKDTIKAIKEYAFKTSDYPVILSLENHCSVEQQRVMAQHMSSILGSALLTSPLGDQMPTGFPSPEVAGYSLYHCLRVYEEVYDMQNSYSSPLLTTHSRFTSVLMCLYNKTHMSGENLRKIQPGSGKSEVCSFSTHCHSKIQWWPKERGLSQVSGREPRARDARSCETNSYIHHNVDKLSRIYPAGTRTDSSNYNPVPLWNAGCQIGKTV